MNAYSDDTIQNTRVSVPFVHVDDWIDESHSNDRNRRFEPKKLYENVRISFNARLLDYRC